VVLPILFLVGEAGIGKTTLWEAGLDEARRRGHRVLLSRPVESESALSYAGLTDLLAGIDQAVFEDLPAAQRSALEAALLRGGPNAADRDHRAVATGMLSVLHGLAGEAPVLVAVDDLQWLDSSTRRALEFAARRCSGKVSILAALRGTVREAQAAQQRLGEDRSAEPLEVRPLKLGALHHLLKQRMGRTYSRPALVRVLEISGGNPFFALELARVLGDVPARAPGTRYPATLAEAARARLDRLDASAQEVLLAAATLAAPTVEVLERLKAGATEALERAEEMDVVEIDGNRCSPPASTRWRHLPDAGTSIAGLPGSGSTPRSGRATWPWPPLPPTRRPWPHSMRRRSLPAAVVPQPQPPSCSSWAFV